MNQQFRVFARRSDPFGQGVDITLWMRRSDSDRPAIAQPVIFEAIPQDDFVARPPTISITNDGVQRLMDELWAMGFRPTSGVGSVGQLAATERHLSDMRHLVFKTKPKE